MIKKTVSSVQSGQNLDAADLNVQRPQNTWEENGC